MGLTNGTAYTFSVAVLRDGTAEPATVTATATPQLVVQFSSAASTVTERGQTNQRIALSFNLAAGQTVGAAITIPFSISGTAEVATLIAAGLVPSWESSDYSMANGVGTNGLSIPLDSPLRSVTRAAIASPAALFTMFANRDNVVEGAETVIIDLTTPASGAGYVLGTQTRHTVTINDPS